MHVNNWSWSFKMSRQDNDNNTEGNSFLWVWCKFKVKISLKVNRLWHGNQVVRLHLLSSVLWIRVLFISQTPSCKCVLGFGHVTKSSNQSEIILATLFPCVLQTRTIANNLWETPYTNNVKFIVLCERWYSRHLHISLLLTALSVLCTTNSRYDDTS